MDGFQAIPRNPYHVQSTSLRSRLHPIAPRVEEQLQQLRASETPSSSTHYKTNMLHDSLDGLRVMYGCVEDLLQLPQTQNAIAQNGRGEWFDRMLEVSLGRLDVCANMKDAFLKMKENLKDLQSTLRWRGTKEDFFYQVKTYMSSKKKMTKKLDKCFRSLKKMETSCDLSFVDNDQCVATVIRVLKEVHLITISIFESLMSFPSSLRETTKLPLVSKWIGSRRVACEGEVKKLNEFERMDAMLHVLGNKSSRNVDVELMQRSQK